MVNVWDMEKQYCTHNFRGSKGVVSLVRFHPDPEALKLFTSCADCSIRVWDLNTSRSVESSQNRSQAVESWAQNHSQSVESSQNLSQLVESSQNHSQSVESFYQVCLE